MENYPSFPTICVCSTALRANLWLCLGRLLLSGSETGEFAVGPDPRDSALIDLRDAQQSTASGFTGDHNNDHNAGEVVADSVVSGGAAHRRVDDQFGVAVDDLLRSSRDAEFNNNPTEGPVDATATDHPPRSFSRVLLRAGTPLVIVLVITLVLFGVMLQHHRGVQSQRALLTTFQTSVGEHRVLHDDVWSATLGVVASGVGAQVATVDDVNELLKRQPSTLSDAQLNQLAQDFSTDVAGDARQSYVAMTTSVRDFIASTQTAVSGNVVSPVELSNELAELADQSATVRAALDDATESMRALDNEVDDAQQRSSWWLIAIGLFGVVGVIGSLWWLRRFFGRHLVQPLYGLVESARVNVVDHEATAEMAANSAPTHPTLDVVADVRSAIAELQSRQMLQQQELQTQSVWRLQDQQLVEALDIAESESEVYQVVGRSLTSSLGSIRAEFIMSERNSTLLHNVAHNDNVPAPHCPVDQIAGCVALRRGEAVVFDDSESVHSCPKMRGRPEGRCAAVCVPVSISARQVGVIHMSTSVENPVPLDQVRRIRTLAGRVGARLETLRAIEHSMREASTDGLTGLPNRRQLEADIAVLVESETPFVMVIADLDKFKRLNDTYGHEVGDKALQLFARVLAENVRGNDVVARLGGEEFVLVYPNMSVEISIEAINRIRAALARALDNSSVPPFTCSFGVTHSSTAVSGDEILRIADAGLLRAKELGGDQAVFADDEMSASIFGQQN